MSAKPINTEEFNRRKEFFMNKKFGRLTIVDYFRPEGEKHITFVKAVCECGTVKRYRLRLLKTGNTKSCGCFHKDIAGKSSITHGMTNTTLYRAWCGMRRRCSETKFRQYKDYGGRGISVCKEWLSFQVFYEWAMTNGYERGLQLDRINNDGNYSPDNCRYVTRKVNVRNSRSINKITIDGITKPAIEWCEIYGIKYGTYKRRKNDYKWPVEDLFLNKHKRRTGHINREYLKKLKRKAEN